MLGRTFSPCFDMTDLRSENAAATVAFSGANWEYADLGADVDAVIVWLYPELRRLARRSMSGARANHTLQTTALVHEAYLRIAETHPEVRGRSQFLALCSQVMRRILIDHARNKGRLKRGSDRMQVTLDEAIPGEDPPDVDMLDLDQALSGLEAIDRRRARMIEGQLFAGMTYPELAEAFALSEATVHRELRLARAWLQRALAEDRQA